MIVSALSWLIQMSLMPNSRTTARTPVSPNTSESNRASRRRPQRKREAGAVVAEPVAGDAGADDGRPGVAGYLVDPGRQQVDPPVVGVGGAAVGVGDRVTEHDHGAAAGVVVDVQAGEEVPVPDVFWQIGPAGRAGSVARADKRGGLGRCYAWSAARCRSAGTG